jgi:hypothetical protein
MPSYIAAFALQQLQDMEHLQQDFGRRRIRRRRPSQAQDDLPLAPAREPAVLWTLQHPTRRASGVSASTTGARGAVR